MLNRLFPFSDSAPQASRGLRTVFGRSRPFPRNSSPEHPGHSGGVGHSRAFRSYLVPGIHPRTLRAFARCWAFQGISQEFAPPPPPASKSTRGIRTMVGIPGHFPVIPQASQGIRTTSGIPSQLSPLSALGYSPAPPRGPLSHSRAQAVIPKVS